MNEPAAVRTVIARLRRLYGAQKVAGKSRILTLGSALTCSINYSKMLRGEKFFFGLAKDVPNPAYKYPETKLGDYVLLVCGSPDKTLVLRRSTIIEALRGVATPKLDVFVEDNAYVLQTTGHPKLNVTEFLNAFPTWKTAPVSDADLQDEDAAQDRMHLKVQWSLILLGKAEGCSVWVPENDRGLSYRRDQFAGHTLERLPNIGFEESARRIVRNIDVLWLKKRVITKAFEVESTTSIYSGLLRLNDLILSQPNNSIDLYVAAPTNRRAQLHRQLLRPSFEHLLPKCRFASFEHILEVTNRIENIPVDRGARVSGLVEGEVFSRPEHEIYGLPS